MRETFREFQVTEVRLILDRCPSIYNSPWRRIDNTNWYFHLKMKTKIYGLNLTYILEINLRHATGGKLKMVKLANVEVKLNIIDCVI